MAAITCDSSGTETLIYIRNAATFDPAEYNRLGYQTDSQYYCLDADKKVLGENGLLLRYQN